LSGTPEVFEALDASTLRLLPWRRFFAESEGWTYKQKKSHQLQLLKALSSEFGLGVESWDDFGNLKITKKDDLRDYRPHHPEMGIPYHTSGSSGAPFAFYRDQLLEPADNAIFERAWRWVGRNHQLVLRLVAGEPKWAYYDSLRNVKPMNHRTIDNSYAEWIEEYRPFIIHGVGGAIRDLAERVIRRGNAKVLRETILYLMSEDTRNHREALRQYFRGIFMGYGTAEARTVASQCRFGTLHVNMETSIAESIGGEIVVTNLLNSVMPFIRYRTGDTGDVLQNRRCRCGVASDVIEGIQGKVFEYSFERGMKRPTGWWLVSQLGHVYSDQVEAWRLEVVPSKKLVRVFVVPRTEKLELEKYLGWLEENLGYKAELIKKRNLPDWRRKLIKVVDN
jgi:phenylacetate-coenzyme A ligase PaaK-like adenylate-forming protein